MYKKGVGHMYSQSRGCDVQKIRGSSAPKLPSFHDPPIPLFTSMNSSCHVHPVGNMSVYTPQPVSLCDGPGSHLTDTRVQVFHVDAKNTFIVFTCEPVVLNLGSIDPQQFSESVSGARWFGSPYSYVSFRVKFMFFLFSFLNTVILSANDAWYVLSLIEYVSNLMKKSTLYFPTGEGLMNAYLELLC